MNDLYKKRFGELESQLNIALASKKTTYNDYLGKNETDIPSEVLIEWKVKARSLIANACGEDSEHFKEFVKTQETGAYGTYLGTLKRLQAIFNAAREDFEGGYLAKVRTLVQAELFESELEQARALLQSGYFVPAAVVAGVVLETALRELCNQQSIAQGKMDKMNAELAKCGIYNSIQQKRITAIAGLRNAAAHGDTSAFKAEDIEGMINDVERFLVAHL